MDGLLARISYKFVRLADALLIMTNLIAMITGNTNFTTPTPTMIVLQAALEDFVVKVQEAVNGGKIATAPRRASRRTLLALVRQLASYVAFTAGSDIAKMLSSGFDAVKASSATVPVNPPSSIQLFQGKDPGTLIVRLIKKGSNGVSFNVQHSESATGPWIDHLPFTAARTTLTELDSGKMYWVHARANSAGGISAWTDPACKRAT
jgi:hypothetical protein